MSPARTPNAEQFGFDPDRVKPCIRPVENPAYCTGADGNPYGQYFPLQRSTRQASVYDPRTRKVTPVDTCFSTHHLQFAEDADHTLYYSGDTNVIGWTSTRIWDETADAAKALGVAESDVIASLEAGDLKGKRIGTQWRITRAQLADFLK